jgi:hypothetical protein
VLHAVRRQQLDGGGGRVGDVLVDETDGAVDASQLLDVSIEHRQLTMHERVATQVALRDAARHQRVLARHAARRRHCAHHHVWLL